MDKCHHDRGNRLKMVPWTYFLSLVKIGSVQFRYKIGQKLCFKQLHIRTAARNPFNYYIDFFLSQLIFSPLWYPHSDSPEGEWWVGLGWVIMGKNKFSLKCFSGKLKLFKNIFFLMEWLSWWILAIYLFLIENQVIVDPPSQLNGKFH